MQQIEFTSSDSSALSIYAPQHPSPTSVKIPVRFNPGYLGDNSRTSLFITLRSPLTGQQVEIPVKLKLFGDHVQCAPDATWINIVSSLWQFVQERAVSVLSLLGACAAMYIGKRICSLLICILYGNFYALYLGISRIPSRYGNVIISVHFEPCCISTAKWHCGIFGIRLPFHQTWATTVECRQ